MNQIATQNAQQAGPLSLPRKLSAALEMTALDLAKPPEHRLGARVTVEMQDEARAIIAETFEYLRPASPETVRRWLAAFGPTVAGRMPEAEIRVRLQAYETALDAPPCCYTKRSLQIAARRFKFFPSVSELCELFDEITLPHRTAIARAKRILQEQPQAARVKAPKTDADRARVTEMVARAKAALAEGSAALKGYEPPRNAPQPDCGPSQERGAA